MASKPVSKSKNEMTNASSEVVREVASSYEAVPSRRSGKELPERLALNFTRALFARLLATSERNLASIEAGKPASPSVVKAINEIRRLIAALRELFDESTIGQWMITKNDAFEGRKPLEVIEHGEVDRIWNMIYELRSGAAL